MTHRVLVFYGSYRSDRMGIRLAQFIVEGLRGRGDDVELIDAKAVGLPMLDRMYKEHPKGEAPAALEQLAGKIRGADGFVFITGEYNWGMFRPGRRDEIPFTKPRPDPPAPGRLKGKWPLPQPFGPSGRNLSEVSSTLQPNLTAS